MDRPTKFMKRSWWILCLAIVLSRMDNSAGEDRAFAPALPPSTNPLPSPKIKDSPPPSISPVGSPNSSSVPRNFLGPVASPPSEVEHHLSPRNHGPSIVSSPVPAPAFRDGRPPAPSRSPSPSPSATKGPANSPFPSSNPAAPTVPARKRHFPPRSSAPPAKSPIQGQGPSPSPSLSGPVPSPSPAEGQSSSPTPAPSALVAPPASVYPPPPPNSCQLPQPCEDPFTNPLIGSPCVCVLPIKVKLRLSVPLYTFFPLVSELAREIGDGVFMDATQVHIMGANAASEHPDKTIVLVDLVPRRLKFDHATAMLTFDRIWRKQVYLNAAYFGDYDVLNVQYPGLPRSPPAPDMVDDLGGKDKPGTLEPFGADVRKRGEGKKPSASVVAVLVLSAVFAVTSCTAVSWFLLWKLKQRDSARLPLLPARHATVLPRAKKALGICRTGPALLSNRAESASDSFSTYTGGPKTFSLGEMERATGNFRESRVVGEGGFGRVYQGTLEGGTLVAVKVLKRVDQRGGKEFLAEIEMLSRLHHRNLVKLLGLCAEDHIRCLVYELIPNGSVSSHLHGADKNVAPLDWAARVKIALGSAKALAYLHEDSNPPVIHRDFKSSNILLDENFTPKVSDFGLARTALNEEGKDHISTRVVGTFGYVAPEYALTGHLLVKSDVYSYGVVLLELLTGKKPVDMSQPPGQENLVAWAHPLLTNKEDLEAIVDPFLGSNLPFENVTKMAAIASMCVQPEVSQRPSMGEVVQALKLIYNGNDSLTEMEDDVL